MAEIVRTNESDPAFLGLVKLLDRDLAARDGEIHGFYAQFNKPVGLEGVVLAKVGGQAVGCGAFKRLDEEMAEVKRMYVREEFRGRRIAAKVLVELEAWAAELGFVDCVLETGLKQYEAIALYTRASYEKIPNYGQYVGVENSVCMKKKVGPVSGLERRSSQTSREE